jgi:acetylornithine deacetylase/succinyl-diaminopimelate desuccinylase-like protein
MIDTALGDMAGEITLHFHRPDDTATESPAQSPLVDAMGRAAQQFYEGATLLPMRMVGTTDARHFRRQFDTAAYGFGIFSERTSLDQIATMAHGDDERIDVESLEMAVTLWETLVEDFLG